MNHLYEVPLDYAHTCMNRFVVLDLRQVESISQSELSDLAVNLCSSPFADDMLVLEASTTADACLRIIGGDGREADFCGNGLIYTASKIGHELGRDDVTIDTARGIRLAKRNGVEWDVEVGKAYRLDAELDDSREKLPADLPVLGLLRVGEPHLILGVPSELPGFYVDRADFENYCQSLRNITDVPGGINVTMVFQQEENSVLIRTYERGVSRHTFSCGTGAVSALAAVFGSPEEDKSFHVCSPGGMHSIRYVNGRWHIAARTERIGQGYLRDFTVHLPISGLTHYLAE